LLTETANPRVDRHPHEQGSDMKFLTDGRRTNSVVITLISHACTLGLRITKILNLYLPNNDSGVCTLIIITTLTPQFMSRAVYVL
jgi:hypothetical protein